MKPAISSSVLFSCALGLASFAGCAVETSNSSAGGQDTSTHTTGTPTVGGTGGVTATGGTGGDTTGGTAGSGATGGVAGGGGVTGGTAGSGAMGGVGGATGGTGGAGDCVPVDDGNPCTLDVCENNMPVHLLNPPGTPCPEPGTVCNQNGQCVGCLSDMDCPGAITECGKPKCDMGTCGTSFTPMGTAVAAQTAHDCHLQVCDGAGNVVNSLDPADVPLDDGVLCTSEMCVAGVPSHVAVANGTACSDGDACTVSDTCQNGVCASGNPVVCGPGKSCQQGTCVGTCTPTLLTKVVLPANLTPYQVAIGDINGDGHPDLAASSNNGDPFASVWLNGGTGTFPTRLDPDVGPTQTGCVIADVNADGKGDVVLGLTESVSSAILLGSANGTFTQGSNPALYSTPSYAAKADFDGDGKVDLAFVDMDVVSVLYNNGNGTFTTRLDLSVPGAHDLVAADFTNDGKADLAITRPDLGFVSIILSQGFAAFATGPSYAIGPNTRGVAAADLNKDGKVDLAVTSFDANKVSVLINFAAGSFNNKVDYPVGAGPHDVAIGDIDVDGAPEIVTTNTIDHSVSMLVNLGNGTFAPKVDFPGTEGFSSIASADLNGDTQADFVVANPNTDELYVFRSACAP